MYVQQEEEEEEEKMMMVVVVVVVLVLVMVSVVVAAVGVVENDVLLGTGLHVQLLNQNLMNHPCQTCARTRHLKLRFLLRQTHDRPTQQSHPNHYHHSHHHLSHPTWALPFLANQPLELVGETKMHAPCGTSSGACAAREIGSKNCSDAPGVSSLPWGFEKYRL